MALYNPLVPDEQDLGLPTPKGLLAEAVNNSTNSTKAYLGGPPSTIASGIAAPPPGPYAPDKDNPLPLPAVDATPPPPGGPGPAPPIPPGGLVGDVFKELETALDPNSRYIQQARQAGLQVAGKRGLINSSIAAGTSEAAALERAGPLAIANAQLNSQLQLQREQIFSTEKLATQQLSSQELMQMRDLAARQGMLTQELDATFRNLQFASGEEKMRLQLQLSQDWQKAQLASSTALQQTQMDADAKLQQIAAQGNVEINLQTLRNLSDAQKAQLAGFIEINNQYANSLNNLYANKDMPAATRDAAIQMFTQLRMANIDYAKTVWGLDLNWGQPPGGTPAPTPFPDPGSTVTPGGDTGGGILTGGGTGPYTGEPFVPSGWPPLQPGLIP